MCDDKHHDHKEPPIHKAAKDHFEKRLGSSIEEREAHHEEHKSWDRRDFLRMTGLAALGGSLMLSGSPVSAFAPNKLLSNLAAGNCGDRTLVLIRLKGGNDGLNMVIPRFNDDYYNIRPTLAVPESNLWGLSGDVGMPNEMMDLQPLWSDGHMQVVHNVGYPNQNYSHFRSSDIWASGSDSNEIVRTGWLGRWLDNEYPSFMEAPPTIPPALQIGVTANLAFRGPDAQMALSISNPTEFYQIASTGQLYDLSQLGNDPNEQELAFVRGMANSAFRYAESIQQAYSSGANQVAYPGSYLAQQLAIVSRLIKGSLGTKIYMVTIGGFDTHANQANNHPNLLNQIATSVKAFMDDLDVTGHSENVLAMTFSEFGRTIFENGSEGTDHGTGAPLLVFGKDIGQNFQGDAPDLTDLDQYGDPYFSVDFRDVYSSVLKNWLCVPEEVVDYTMGQTFDGIPGLVPPSDPPIGLNDRAALLGHQPDPNTLGSFLIKYSIKVRGQVRIQITDTAGHPLRTILNEFREKGSYTLSFNPVSYYLPSGEYRYRLETGGKLYVQALQF